MSTALAEYEEALGELVENSIDFVKNLPSPRYIKSHIPLELLPVELDKVKPKIIYTLRNPKDTCVSYYYHCKTTHHLDVTFEEFCDLFIDGLVPVGPILPHYLSFWNKRHESNVLVLKYEDMKKDLRGTLKKIAAHLDKRYSEEEYDKLCDFLSFEKMKDNKGCNLEGMMEAKYGKGIFEKTGDHFIRKGVVGDWKNHMSPEMSKRFDDWIEKHTAGTDLTFD